MREVSINVLEERLAYDSQTGVFTWKQTNRWIKEGSRAGTISNGYVKISVNKVIIPAHRIAWAMTHKAWPFGEIDHINGVRSDNRICNLREVTHQQNCFNRSMAANNRSGYKGVSWHATGNKWQAHISVAGKTIYLGLFETKEEAAQAYAQAAKKLHSVFARHQ